jgi:hypothetical protein
MLFKKIVEKAVRQDDKGYYVKKEQYDQIRGLFRRPVSDKKQAGVQTGAKKPCKKCLKNVVGSDTIALFNKAMQLERDTIINIKTDLSKKKVSIDFGGF